MAMTLTLSLMLVEFVVGRFLFFDLNQGVDKIFDAELGWKYKPGTYYIKPDTTFVPHEIQINELGLREGSTTDFSDGEKLRIVVLGDSFTFAKAVRDEDIYTSQLKKNLSNGSGKKYEIINAGIEGFGNAQQLILMKRLVEKDISGHLYVLQVFPNDILDNLRLDYGSKKVNPVQPGYVIDDAGQLEFMHRPVEPDRATSGNKTRTTFSTIRVARILIETRIQSHPNILNFIKKFDYSQNYRGCRV